MKCRIKRHFIRFFTVCNSIHKGVSRLKGFNEHVKLYSWLACLLQITWINNLLSMFLPPTISKNEVTILQIPLASCLFFAA